MTQAVRIAILGWFGRFVLEPVRQQFLKQPFAKK
jgi:hypothetical protein